MIIFPFGFYVLEGKRPIYVGNDLEAQKAMRAWMEANPHRVHLRLEVIGLEQPLTRFRGCDESGRSAAMDYAPLLFETTCYGRKDTVRRLYHDYDAALRGHAELIEISRKRLH
ncbi:MULTISPECIES: hypothetical protein [unclassified Bradyrhizobium]|uniref:hypothetical protein n=1 Tax=unclassified Bradyrhizobium TaxID=2631580 RepID=UPI003396D9D0